MFCSPFQGRQNKLSLYDIIIPFLRQPVYDLTGIRCPLFLSNSLINSIHFRVYSFVIAAFSFVLNTFLQTIFVPFAK